MKKLPSKVIIIGAGPSGLFAARQLKQIAQEQGKTIEIVLLERESVVGGKCHTYKDPKHPELRTEEGAGAIAPNYGVVIDALKEHHIDFETMIPVANETVEIKQIYDSLSAFKKLSFINKLRQEICTFNEDYDVYQKAVQNKTKLPPELELPFSEYSTLKNMNYLPTILKPFVPGFGYGAVTHCPAYSVLEYMGKTTIPEILMVDNFTKKPSLLAIHGGFQLLMEKIAEHLDVRLNATVNKIQREPNKVTVCYQHNGKDCVATADSLILATSPQNWPSLGLDMTAVEQDCVNNLEYYRYPVAVYKIKGLPHHQYYFPKALEASGFGHVALITTRDDRDNPPDGRLCTIYVNLPPGANHFKFCHKTLAKELMTIAGVTGVEVVKEKIWEDYMSTLTWDQRLALAADEERSNTVHLGSYALGGFEDVACVASLATTTMNAAFSAVNKSIDGFSATMGRISHYFFGKTHPPLKQFDTAEVAGDRVASASTSTSMAP